VKGKTFKNTTFERGFNMAEFFGFVIAGMGIALGFLLLPAFIGVLVWIGSWIVTATQWLMNFVGTLI